MTPHGTPPNPAPPPLGPTDCSVGSCATCADEAVPRPVVEFRPGGLALVETETGREEISVALVEARAGDVVLVHAGEAIGVVGTHGAGSRP